MLDNLKYPIGPFVLGKDYTLTDIKENIKIFGAFPHKLEALVKDWSDDKLSVTYRNGGWNGRQVIHHLADSHCNLVLRVKGALTEDPAQIKPYDENRWSHLYDGSFSSIESSLQILKGIHARLTDLFNNLNLNDWQTTTYHPGSKHTFTLAELLAHYAWHGEHHYAHLLLVEKNYNNLKK